MLKYIDRAQFEKRIVVVTAPHSVCSNESNKSNRQCDLLALTAVRCINEANSKKKGSIVDLRIFLPLKTERRECDLNRDDECAIFHPYRLELTKFVKTNRNDISFAMDVHSFPSSHEEWGFSDIVVLEDTDLNEDKDFSTYSLDFVQFMENSLSDLNLNITLLRGEKNAIMREMKNVFKLKSFLIEFNEDLKESRLQKICIFIIIWLNSISVTK